MARPVLRMAEVFRRYGDVYRARAGAALSTAHLRVMAAIEQCRTAGLGGHVEACDRCGHKRVWYNSCRNRHCPSCQSLVRARWVDARIAELLDCEYFHVVFTVPRVVAAIAQQNPTVVYGILFRATAETQRTIAADPEHLGAEIGFSRKPIRGAARPSATSHTIPTTTHRAARTPEAAMATDVRETMSISPHPAPDTAARARQVQPRKAHATRPPRPSRRKRHDGPTARPSAGPACAHPDAARHDAGDEGRQPRREAPPRWRAGQAASGRRAAP